MVLLAFWKVWWLGFGEIDYNALVGRGDTVMGFYLAGAETLKVVKLEGDRLVDEVIAVDPYMRHPGAYWDPQEGTLAILSKDVSHGVIVYLRDSSGSWRKLMKSLPNVTFRGCDIGPRASGALEGPSENLRKRTG